jgi:predicted pyridoxine 5'-phosphate oxidase superfamily flavin-nucleotide-binding protein
VAFTAGASPTPESGHSIMSKNSRIASDIAFTPVVKAIQARRGSRAAYARMEEGQGWNTAITPELTAFIAAQSSVFLGTANAAGQPYIQHRGGPPGFLRVLDEQTIAFADLRGNRQFITQGNLAENPKAHLFLIDYANRQRIKLWGEARGVEDDAALLADLMPEDGKSRGEQVLIFRVLAWDANCPKHIPQRFDAVDMARVLEQRDQRIAELESKIAQLLDDRAIHKAMQRSVPLPRPGAGGRSGPGPTSKAR